MSIATPASSSETAESISGISREGSELATQHPTVVIGSGPYGLSVAAHMRAAGIPTLTFGRPMEYWERMPRGMDPLPGLAELLLVPRLIAQRGF